MPVWKKILPISAVLFVGWVGLNIFATDAEPEPEIPRVPVPFESSAAMMKAEDARKEWKRQKDRLQEMKKQQEENERVDKLAKAVAERLSVILVERNSTNRYANLPADMAAELIDQDIRLAKLLNTYAGKKNEVTIEAAPLTGIPSPDGKRVFNKGESLDFEWDSVHELYKATIRTNVNGVDITEFGAFAPTDPWSVIYKEKAVVVSTACMHESSLDPFETIYQRQYYRILKCEEIVPPDLSEQ